MAERELVISSVAVQDAVSLTRTIAAALDKDPIILSHHPLCGKFDDHVFRVRGRYLCLGCMTIYPSALAAVVLLKTADLDFFSLTFPLAVFAFGTYFLRFALKWRALRALLNVSLGVSVAASVLCAFNAPANQQFLVVAVGLAVAVTFSYLKGRRVFVACRKCDRYAEFPSCGNPPRAQPVNRLS